MERFESANGALGGKPRSRPAARWLASSPVRAPRRPLARGCFAGRSRPRWSSLGGSSFTRQIAPLGHALRRADPPAVRSPCPSTGQPRPAGQPLRSLRSLFKGTDKMQPSQRAKGLTGVGASASGDPCVPVRFAQGELLRGERHARELSTDGDV